ncbi:MAG: sulfatase-like hydrolase/transferase, partial [Planctomycetaceae bacterium]
DGYDTANVELPPTFIDTPETRRYRTMYYTDITLMDRRLGAVYDSVKQHLGENTLFIYTSDHGAQWPFGKWNLYDAGIRVPMLAVWPGRIKPKSTCDAMISFADVLPTFIELTAESRDESRETRDGESGSGPSTLGFRLDGRSFAAVLRGDAAEHRDEIYATHSGDGNMNVYPIRCVRTRTHKYILNLHPEFEYATHIDLGSNPDGLEFWRSWERAAESDPRAAEIVARYHRRPREELYDLRTDPHELHNLADSPQHAELLADLRGKVKAWMKSQGDPGRVFGEPRPLAVSPKP